MFNWWRENKELFHLFLTLTLGVGLVLYWGIGLPLSTTVATSVALALVLVAGFEQLLRSRHRMQNTPVCVETHPVFGEVRVFRESWKSGLSGTPFHDNVELVGSGSSNAPSQFQVELFEQLREQYPHLHQLALAALADACAAVEPALIADDLKMTTIYLGKEGRRFFKKIALHFELAILFAKAFELRR